MLSPKNPAFVRVSGAENTFFIIDLFNPEVEKNISRWTTGQKENWIKKICSEYFSFRTDGVIFLKKDPEFDFTWDFYNSDASPAEMCGNAARCAILYFHHQIAQKNQIRFRTAAGEIQGQVLGKEWVQVQMTRTHDEKKDLEIENFGSGYFVNTGVPHFVVERSPDKEWARKLRSNPVFGNPGSNITFVKILSRDQAEAVTYERGVEDFTQACGTGAVAAALYLKSKAKDIKSAKILMPGGQLIVENLELGERPLLIGGAKFELELRTFESGDKD